MSETVIPCVGLMSGTSLDGLDIVGAEFTRGANNSWSYAIKFAKTLEFPAILHEALKHPFQIQAQELAQIDRDFIQFTVDSVNSLLSENPTFKPLFIASHGQTLFHQPQKGYTYQLGNGSYLAAATGLPCISDFRSADVALGGQGAPLVPTGDQLLFNEFTSCLNLGGFANFSHYNGRNRIAQDICPLNFVLNRLAEEMDLPFDKGGKWAKKGKTSENLTTALNQMHRAYFEQQAHRSLGVEDVLNRYDPILSKYSHLPVEDRLATYTQFAADRIVESIPKGDCLVTGGGAYNTHLIDLLNEHQQINWHLPDQRLIEFKEALIFAFLGALRWCEEVNVYASVTGALRNHCAGALHL